ncbi:hypothetical protein GCM10010840_27160 [Deinococcus aerolatus]|uniref:Uncharacterized protein n=1 Tax=Deinococcus aerolatus TaxID=522487 RepID=A0ABQ2GCW6_9DEIO|nr:hypothetical protein [Deinococcus aerolatus]GGL87731.1 hypothetical protein GCM10010840_27160 [Deinococcus aerolatus]
MKKILTMLLTLTAMSGMNTSFAESVPWAVVVANTRGADTLTYDHLSTECAWQGLALPDDVLTALGDPRQIVVKVGDLPENVKVSVRPGRTDGVVGLKITRTDKSQAVRQMGRIILTNPATGYSYTVQAMVVGMEVAAN